MLSLASRTSPKVYQHHGLFYELMLISDVSELPMLCERFGKEDPYIWKDCLQKAVASQSLGVTETLIKRICECNIATVYSIVNILSKRAKCHYDLAAKYVMSDVSKLHDQRGHSRDGERVLHDKADLRRMCRVKIDRPSEHSFHIGCLGDEPYVCPVCKETHRTQ